MDLAFNETQQMLKTSARELLAQECPLSLVRAMEEDTKGYTDELWQQMVDLGWLGLVFPEEYEARVVISWTLPPYWRRRAEPSRQDPSSPPWFWED